MNLSLSICLVSLYFFLKDVNCHIESLNKDSDYNEDSFLLVPELIKKYGYPIEIHNVTTSDGYILEMHRIPTSRGIPVLLQHGLIASSAEWVIMGTEKGLGYYLHQQRYDVWLANGRGNRYSRKHVNLNVKDKEFWDFSFHELGLYDLPAIIDYIINETLFKKIHYIGTSQGTTSFWAMCSLRPAYSEKIISMHALAPVAYIDHAKTPLLLPIGLFPDTISILADLFGIHEFLPYNNSTVKANQKLCKDKTATQSLCVNLIYLSSGYGSDQLNKSSIDLFLGHFPSGGSIKEIIHYGQIKKYKEFQFFDYGLLNNMAKYGTLKPSEYNLNHVKTPVVLYYGENDWLADSIDVFRLRDKLPNVVALYKVANLKFNHLDFLIGIDVKNLVYIDMIKMMKELEKMN